MATTPTSPTSTPMTMLQGATFIRTISAFDSNNNPIDFTGYTIHMQVRSLVGSSTALLDLSTTNGAITISTTTVTITATAAQTAALSFGATNLAYYDIKFTSPSGVVTRLLQGAILLDLEITA